MNITEAKEQVKYAVISYLSRNEFGDYIIPIERQRPLFLMGPPGIGKTDIITQIACEMDIALVSYSMTHHTRQSALGLPFIATKEYGGQEYRTTEYTMSEIIASVYDVMEATGKKEGILFLDEINCISETLAPSMLQFLQFKTFGRHRVPEGWVVVTAGNPAEYNDSVRDFDLATLDRLKRLDIEPDVKAWLSYAAEEDVHAAVVTYLEIKKDDFYSVRTTIDGKEFVTARGWVDLSDMIKLYEKNDLPVTIDLIRQYVHDERIARDFSAYYDLFYRFRKDYRIDEVLDGVLGPDVLARAARSRFDERLAVVRMITDALHQDFRDVYEDGKTIRALLQIVKDNKEAFSGDLPEALDGALAAVAKVREANKAALAKGRMSRAISKEDARIALAVETALSDFDMYLRKAGTVVGGPADTAGDRDGRLEDVVRAFFSAKNAERKARSTRTGERLEHAYRFLEQAYGGTGLTTESFDANAGEGGFGQRPSVDIGTGLPIGDASDRELLIFTTSLTENKYSADFISTYGSDAYFRHNKGLLLYEREKDLAGALEQLQ